MNNPNYIPYSQQERHRVIDATVESSAEALQIPEVAQRLGWYAAGLADLLNRVTIPNLHHNEVVMTGHRTNDIPVIALHIGERAFRRPIDLTFNASQKYAINKRQKSRNARDVFKMQRTHYEQDPYLHPVPAFQIEGPTAVVHVKSLEGQQGSKTIYAHSRPLVAFSLDHESNLSPIVALHEFTHVLQTNLRPISEHKTGEVSPELEAYYVGAQVALGYKEAGREEELLGHTPPEVSYQALAVESIRHRHNQSKNAAFSFHSSPELMSDLFNAELVVTHDMYNLLVSREHATL